MLHCFFEAHVPIELMEFLRDFVSEMRILFAVSDGATAVWVREHTAILVALMARYESLFGSAMCGINSHLLLHLPEQVRLWGALWDIWLYGFERANGQMVSQAMNSRKRTRRNPEKCMARKLQSLITLRTTRAADQDVVDLMTSVFPSSGTTLNTRVQVQLSAQIQRLLCSLLEVQVLGDVEETCMCTVGALYLSTSTTPLVNDARVRFKPTFDACRYAEVQQLLYVQQAAQPAADRSGFVAVVRFYSIDQRMHRRGTLQHRYHQATGNDVVVEPSEATKARLAKHLCVFVEEIECKVAFIEMIDATRTWGVVHAPPRLSLHARCAA